MLQPDFNDGHLFQQPEIDIQYKPKNDHANADGLFGLPVETQEEHVIGKAAVFNIKQMELLPNIAFQFKNTTCYDPVLCKVLKHVKKGWPNTIHISSYIMIEKRNCQLKTTVALGYLSYCSI